MLVTATYLAVGSVAGVLAGLLGVGGGLVIVPALARCEKTRQRRKVRIAAHLRQHAQQAVAGVDHYELVGRLAARSNGRQPCDRGAGGVSHCEGRFFICRNGKVSQSKKSCADWTGETSQSNPPPKPKTK